MKKLFEHINEMQAYIYKNEESFLDKFFNEFVEDEIYLYEIMFGDGFLTVRVATHIGPIRKIDVDSVDLLSWMKT